MAYRHQPGEIGGRAAARRHGWSITRLVPLLAGTFVLMSALLAAVFSQWWFFTGFVGANLLLYGAVGWCPVTLLLRRAGVPAESISCPPATSNCTASQPKSRKE
ncbi:DUF2892 domain-containing protein [Nocardia sp. NPDC059246]|uniref:YgaP family membrane protein n=1 Tax=unclassified Nocardia TaxID=2637762 RepID=UPI00369F6AB5